MTETRLQHSTVSQCIEFVLNNFKFLCDIKIFFEHKRKYVKAKPGTESARIHYKQECLSVEGHLPLADRKSNTYNFTLE